MFLRRLRTLRFDPQRGIYTEIAAYPNKHTLENEMSDTREAFYKAFPRHAGVIEMHEQGAIGHLDAMTAIHQFAVWQAATEQSAKEIADLRNRLAAEQALRNTVNNFVLELAEAVDNAHEDIGGSRPQLDILRDAVQSAQTSPTAALDAKIAEAEIKVLKKKTDWLVYEQAGVHSDKTKFTEGYRQACSDIAGFFEFEIAQRKEQVK
jgi:hypothetical protein